jgi:hypothetical protein
MSDLPPFRLGGETDPNAWHFSRLGEAGPLPNPVGHTFPLVTHDVDGKWRLVGTGFYVNDSGFFVTARHVVEEVCREGNQIAPLLIMHLQSKSGLFGASECHFRPIGQCWTSGTSDVAFGAAATATNRTTSERMKNWTWTLSCRIPVEQSLVHTYAFPNHAVVENGRRIRFSPHAYRGRVLSSGNYRDSVMVPFPYIEVDFRIHGAASGGPIVFGSHVVGVNCTEWPENLDHPPGPGFGAQSCCLVDAYLDNIVLPSESLPRRVTFDELICAGALNVENYSPRTENGPLQGQLIDLTMSASTPYPHIELEQYF